MNQSKEPAISFVQQKRMDDMKGRVKVDTHSRIFGWLDDHTKCKDASTNDRQESNLEQLPMVECGLAMEKAPEMGNTVDSSKASIFDTIKTVDEERTAAAVSISTPDNGSDSRVQSVKQDEVRESRLDWPPKEPTKGIKRNADRNASHI